MADLIGFLATTFTLLGIVVQTSAPPARRMFQSYLASCAGSVLWITYALMVGAHALIFVNAVILLLGLRGLYQWWWRTKE